VEEVLTPYPNGCGPSLFVRYSMFKNKTTFWRYTGHTLL